MSDDIKTTRRRKPSVPSTITELDPAIKNAVDTAIREGRATIDKIVSMIKEMGGDASRSAVGRYVANAREQLEEYQQAQQVAAVWVDKIGKEPQGDMGRLLIEMLRLIAYKSVGGMSQASPEDLMFLAKALKDIGGADKLMVDRSINVHKLMQLEAAKVAAQVGKTAKKAGMSDETVELIRSQILGIPSTVSDKSKTAA